MVIERGEQSAGSSEGWTATNKLPVTYSWPQAERAPASLISPIGVMRPLKLARLLNGVAVVVVARAARYVSPEVAVSFILNDCAFNFLLLFIVMVMSSAWLSGTCPSE